MIRELQTGVYKELRDAASLTQGELAVASGLSRSNINRIEKAKKVPTKQEEEAIRLATDNTLVSVAELVCKVLSELIGRRVTIRADETGYLAATPEAELNELLAIAYDKMPRDRWWAWRDRVGRFKHLGQLYDAQGYAHVRDLSAEVEALCREEEKSEEREAELPAKTG